MYNHTFDLARSEGQRSLGKSMKSSNLLYVPIISKCIGLETAQAFWALLLPHGAQGGALKHVNNDADDDVMMDGDDGWKEEYLQWWFDFLNQKGLKGVSKDTWIMVCDDSLKSRPISLISLQPRQFLDFVRSTNSTFENYDVECTHL